jgi:hypothetical protein
MNCTNLSESNQRLERYFNKKHQLLCHKILKIYSLMDWAFIMRVLQERTEIL